MSDWTDGAAGARGEEPRPAGRAGGAALALVLWILALALVVAPFLRAPDGPTRDYEDFGRVEADVPFDLDVADFEAEFELDLSGAVEEASARWLDPPDGELVRAGLVDAARLPSGRAAYVRHCSGCHGESGDGAGPAARVLAPRPRNFRKGVFKFTSTETGKRPLPADLFRTITEGLAGSAMPEFRLLPEELRWDLVEYVRYLSMRGELERLVLDSAWEEEELPDAEELAEIVRERWSDLRAVYPSAQEPELTRASIERGRELFLDAARGNCVSCHGEGGRGDGPSAGDFTDDWGYPVRPRDFTTGVYRAGQTGADLWRSIATGVNGTPMTSSAGVLSPEEIWHVVHYVRSLAD